jgi:hypothetical protein
MMPVISALALCGALIVLEPNLTNIDSGSLASLKRGSAFWKLGSVHEDATVGCDLRRHLVSLRLERRDHPLKSRPG